MAPESVEVQMFPPELSNVTAASFVPSLDEVMDFQAFVLPGEAVFSVHVAPESVEVQMFPFRTTAASLVPSLEEVMEYQFFPLPGEAVFSVHVRACTGPHAHNKRNMVNRRRDVRDPRRQRAKRFIFGGVHLRSKVGYVLNCPQSEHTRVVSHATGRLAAAQATKCFVNFLSFAPSFGEWSRFQARSTLTRTSEASPGSPFAPGGAAKSPRVTDHSEGARDGVACLCRCPVREPSTKVPLAKFSVKSVDASTSGADAAISPHAIPPPENLMPLNPSKNQVSEKPRF